MRTTMAVMALLTCAASQLPAQEPTPVAIFRYINIQPYGRIELGGPFAQVSVLGAPISPGLYQLVGPSGRPTQFADTKAILIELTEAELVQAFYFLYLPSIRTFAQREASYVEDLGTPERFAYDSAGSHVTRSRWQDPQTEFELIEVTGPSAATMLSVLRDRHPAKAVQPGS